MGFSLEEMIDALELALSEPETDAAKVREANKTLKWWTDYARTCGALPRAKNDDGR